MKKQMIIIISVIILMIIPSILGEMYIWNTVSRDYTNSLVRQTASYWFSDTSENGVGRNKDINLILWSEVEELPFNFLGVYPVAVDWCNYTIDRDINIYDEVGNLLNVTNEKINYYFANQPLNSTQLLFKLRSRDSLRVIMDCHYTNSTYLYVENSLIGRFYTYFPSFECVGCEEYSLEEITNQVEVQEKITQNELGIYTKIQTIIEWNWTIWLILGWIIRFAFLMIALMLLFSGVYYYYKFLTNLFSQV